MAELHQMHHRYAHATEVAAARKILPKAPTIRESIKRLIATGFEGLTADEAIIELGGNPYSIRPRFTELHRDGEIRPSGRTRKNRRGNSEVVWELGLDPTLTNGTPVPTPQQEVRQTNEALADENKLLRQWIDYLLQFAPGEVREMWARRPR